MQLVLSLFFLCLLSGAVDASSSVFTYANGQTFEDFRDVSFAPVFEAVCSSEEEQWVTDNCDGNALCRYDYCVTRDPSVAMNTMLTLNNFDLARLALSKLPLNFIKS